MSPPLLTLFAYFLAYAGMSATQTTYPTTVELDLVFPRDNTYAPTELMPLVFAVQNSQAASSLGLTIDWQIGRIGSADNLSFSGFWDLTSTNYSSDPYYIFTYTPLLNETEGDFKMLWYVYAANCSSSGSTDPSFWSGNKYVTFTLQNGAQQPDLVAATGPETCATMPNQTFNVVETLPQQIDPGESGRNSCAVLAEPSPTANPCAVPLGTAQASSISAGITASACAGSHPDLTTGCPQPSQTSNANLDMPVGFMWAVFGLLGLVHAGVALCVL
ncbi:hypothetical protein VSDG_00884 [Cytospora chrysosperma]|uniref:DUF7136 domain-containing protein n=1 Tax=Cytospora chrysosperma TaxID=252740 RepID=A0A423WKY1_CYTCH|nr:hypothetical protein VSDG_00884 [Valsa sordida]